MTRLILVLTMVLGLASCAPSKFRTYDGPEVTRIEVHKAARKMYLLHHGEVLRSFDIALGGNPVGHKVHEGDQRTPEGAYLIDRRNPNSNFHLSIGISYPNERDVEVARALGLSPGGDIFIHGRAGKHRRNGRGRDWTDGCIAVTDREMEDIYAMVRDGTVIMIYP
ncbi:MAG: murein L,D-transpeptidase family protein [Gemmobacter sp.]